MLWTELCSPQMLMLKSPEPQTVTVFGNRLEIGNVSCKLK